MKFSNKNLHDIHVTAEQSISSHLAKLNDVSNDIKVLDATLSKSGISYTLLYLFENIFEERYKKINEYESLNVIVTIEHFIVWDRDKQRLLYEIHETVNEMVISPEQPSRQWGPHICQSKPLIETKTHIRLKVLPELQFFYSKIMNLLGQGHLQEKIIVRSPHLLPF